MITLSALKDEWRPKTAYLAAAAVFLLLAVITWHTEPFKDLGRLILPDSTPQPQKPLVQTFLHPLVVFANPGFGFGFVLGLGTIGRWKQIFRPFLLLLATALLGGILMFTLAIVARRALGAAPLFFGVVAFYALLGAPYSVPGALIGFALRQIIRKGETGGVA